MRRCCHVIGVQKSGAARGDCLSVCPQTISSFEQWCMVVIVTGYALFVTSQYDVMFTFANEGFGKVCWHNMHVIRHALSLLVVLQSVTVMNTSALQVTRPEQNTALNAKTEQFTTAKCSNALKQWSKTHLMLRQGSSQLQKHQGARMSRRTAVDQRRHAAGMAETQGWQFETC